MKLVSAHINGFGKIRDKDYCFESGVFEVLANNGEGKSTLAAFIKAMFYGMETVKKSDTAFKDRAHYYPFAGGNFGGSITFKLGDDTYRLEREFAQSSATNDTLLVYKNNNPDDSLKDPVGEKVFGLNKESFERLLFIDEKAVLTGTTTDINKRLNNDVDNMADDFDLDKVLKKLDTLAKECEKDAKSRSSLQKEKNAELANLKTTEKGLKRLREKLRDLQADIKKNERELKLAGERNILIDNWQVYDSYIAETTELEARKAELEETYKQGFPSEIELKEVRKELESIRAKEEELSRSVLTDEEERKLDRLKENFSFGEPTFEELEENKISVKDLSNDNVRLEGLKEAEFDTKLLKKFNERPLEDADRGELEKLIKRYKDAKEVYDRTPDTIQREAKRTVEIKHSHKTEIILFSFAGVFLAAWLATALWADSLKTILEAAYAYIASLALICMSGILFGVGLVIFLKKFFTKTRVEDYIETVENPDKLPVKNEMTDAESAVKQRFLYKYDYPGEDVVLEVHDLKAEFAKYSLENERFNKNSSAAEAIAKDIEERTALLTREFGKYGIKNTDFNECEKELENNYNLFKELRSKKESLEEHAGNLKKDLQTCLEKKLDFEKKYLFEANDENLRKAEFAGRSYENCLKELEDKKKKAQNFKEEKALTERPAEGEVHTDLEESEARLKDMRREEITLARQLSEDEETVEKIPEVELELAENAEKEKNLKKKKESFNKTADFLKLAEQKQKDRFAKPVKDRFVEYSAVIKSVLGQHIYMDKDYKITYEKDGKIRKTDNLSSGETAVCALSFRLAVLDNMFDSEFPFVVLDDPFMALDADNMEAVRKIINELSKTRQVIYLTCSKERSLVKN
ncbi:MAG: AAA family ATPase [Lachnospiraceae bacterium]|nr:AAA family ATPase [Lachnospiraceae bacterium]